MKHHFILTGHGGFFNRGCEAIVRSTVTELQKDWDNPEFILYSYNHELDRAELKDNSINIRPLDPSYYNSAWLKNMIVRRFPWFLPIYREVIKYLSHQTDVCLSVGGDNYTFDYGLPMEFILMDRFFMALGIPVVIWGASIGPFETSNADKNIMREHLQSVNLITARESVTVNYLKSLGVTRNVVKVYDPAFLLNSDLYDGPEQSFVRSGNVIGLNISALIAKWRTDQNLESLINEVILFVEAAISEGFKILLIPHVFKKGGPLNHNDEAVLELIYKGIKDAKENIALLPGGISTQKIKWLISHCQFFIGARTHSTIAALSTGVPTVSISYSQKAIGINRDIFGHEEYVLPTPIVSRDTLLEKLKLLQKREADIRCFLKDKNSDMVNGARQNFEVLKEFLDKKN